jgi:hypothetical protein
MKKQALSPDMRESQNLTPLKVRNLERPSELEDKFFNKRNTDYGRNTNLVHLESKSQLKDNSE